MCSELDLLGSINALGVSHRDIVEHGIINAVEAALFRMPEHIKFELEEHVVGGFYLRKIFMPAGAMLTTKRHKTWHSFYVTEGACSWFEEVTGKPDKTVHAVANGDGEHFVSLTQPGTRRLLFCHTDTIWTTVHPTSLTDIDEINATLTYKHFNPLVPDEPI